MIYNNYPDDYIVINAKWVEWDNDFKDLVYENNSLKQQLKSQPAEIVDKIRKELGLKLKYKLNDEVCVLKICNQINEILDTILKEYQKGESND